MIVGLLVLFIGACLLLYVLFGGADYGAGVLECFKGQDNPEGQQALIDKVIGPVWEANHIWLILIIVILFMGFPELYTTVSIYLHIPLVAVLLGIIGRGCAFSFRHYDAIKDGSQRVYTLLFSFSSVWTCLWLGVLVGSLLQGSINPKATSYRGLYIDSWLSPFTIAVGVFFLAICTFLAAIYLIGETEDKSLKLLFRKRAFVANFFAVISGGMLFLISYLFEIDFTTRFFSNPLSVACMIIASLLFVPLYRTSVFYNPWKLRLCAAFQVSLILFGWYALEYPYALRLAHQSYTFADLAAPEATLRQLLYALLFGSLLIFPSLGYLFWVMGRERKID